MPHVKEIVWVSADSNWGNQTALDWSRQPILCLGQFPSLLPRLPGLEWKFLKGRVQIQRKKALVVIQIH